MSAVSEPLEVCRRRRDVLPVSTLCGGARHHGHVALRSSGLTLLLIVALLLAGCGRIGNGGTSSAGSCADVIVFDGARYVGGRGVETTTPALVGGVMHAATAPCADGNPATSTVDVRAIDGVLVTDAVATTNPTRVLLSERLWPASRASLPRPLQPYIQADRQP